MVGAGRPRVADGVQHQLGDVGRLQVERRLRIQPGEQQQVLHERRHPARLRLDAAQGVLGVGRQLVVGPAGQLGVPPDRGERVAQLVGGVGDEPAHLGLGAMPGRQRLLDVVEHLVEGEPHPSDLVAGVGVPRSDPDRDDPLAGFQWQGGDLGRGRGQPVQRPQAALHHPTGADVGERDRPQREQAGHHHQAGQRRGDLRVRQRDHGVEGGVAGEHPVGADARQGDARRLPRLRHRQQGLDDLGRHGDLVGGLHHRGALEHVDPDQPVPALVERALAVVVAARHP